MRKKEEPLKKHKDIHSKQSEHASGSWAVRKLGTSKELEIKVIETRGVSEMEFGRRWSWKRRQWQDSAMWETKVRILFQVQWENFTLIPSAAEVMI